MTSFGGFRRITKNHGEGVISQTLRITLSLQSDPFEITLWITLGLREGTLCFVVGFEIREVGVGFPVHAGSETAPYSRKVT